jgi:hypothetical protein
MPDYKLQTVRLFSFFMRGVLATKTTVFAKLKLFRLGSFVLRSCVISLLALSATKRDYISHSNILCMD